MVLEKSLFDVYGIDAIYHMSHIDNVASILKYGLLSHDISYNKRLTKRDISDISVNSRRTKREPIYGQSIHSYVPFYFNPKNAMLYRRRDIQENIVLFAFDRELIAEAGVLFTDGNAASGDTRFFYRFEDLSQLHWNCLHANSWNSYPDGKREFLSTYRSLGIESIAFPILGADRGAISQERSLEIMHSYLNKCDIDIEIWHFDPTAKDDKYESFKALLESLDDKKINEETGIGLSILKKIREGMENPSINSLSGLLRIKGVGERSLEKLFGYVESKSKEVTLLSYLDRCE